MGQNLPFKLDRKEVVVIVVTLLALVTLNAWWRVKETGRRMRAVVEASEGGAPMSPRSP